MGDDTTTFNPGTATDVRAQLVVLDEHGTERRSLPDAGTVVVGRGRDADVIVDRPWISRRHFTLDLGERITIEDLGSRIGVVVAGRRLRAGERRVLRPGELVEVGRTTLIVKPGAPDAQVLAREAFTDALERLAARARELATDLHVVVVRVDGPELLATELLASDRGFSLVGRLRDRVYAAAAVRGQALVEHLRGAISARDLPVRFGCAVQPHDGTAAGALVDTAERRLPRALFGGRRQVIVASAAMKELVERLHSLAATEVPILLVGEGGVGKATLARVVHDASPRAGEPFATIGASTTDADVHERIAAWTGPRAGTLHLRADELAPDVQARVVAIWSSLRVRVLATSRVGVAELRERVRPELLARVQSVVLTVPPLRERRDDLAPLAESFAVVASVAAGRRPVPLSAEVQRALAAAAFPGNVRALEDAVTAAVSLAAGHPLAPEHFPSLVVATSSLKSEVDDLERDRITRVLEACGGNQSRAAKELGIARNTLIARMQRYGIGRPRAGRSSG